MIRQMALSDVDIQLRPHMRKNASIGLTAPMIDHDSNTWQIEPCSWGSTSGNNQQVESMLNDELHRRTFAVGPDLTKQGVKHHENIYMEFAFGYKSAISMEKPGIKTGIN